MNDLRTAAQQVLEAMRCGVPTGRITLYAWDKALSDLDAALAQKPQTTHSADCWRWHHACAVAMIEREQAREIAAQALSARERELLQGLIERELWHAKTCDAILARPDGNHRMASAQKGWDMERVALLRKLGGLGA